MSHIELNVACWGAPTAPLVIALHGYPELHLAWSDLAAGLVAAGFVVVAPDQRGYNLSDKPSEVDAYSVAHLTADLAGLFEATGRQRVWLLGHDWGGLVAFLFAHAHPERVRGLVAFNAPHPDIWGNPELDPVQAAASDGYVPLVAGPLSSFALPYLEWELAPHLTEAELSAYRSAWQVPGAFPSAGKWFQANVYPDVHLPRDVHVAVPTLAIWGLDDGFVTPSQLDHLPGFVEDLEVLRLEGVDHWVTHQRTQEILEAVTTFERRLEPERAR